MSIHNKLINLLYETKQNFKKTPISEKAQKYYEIVFLQGDDAKEPLKILDEVGKNKAIEYLKDWDYGEEMEHSPVEEPWGSDDDTYEKDPYILTYNNKLGYISLLRKVGEEADGEKETTPETTKERVDMTGRMMVEKNPKRKSV